MLEYYVLNYNFNKHKVEMFNIFRNWVLEEEVIKEIKKYILSPKNYKYIKQYSNPYLNREEIAIYGYEAFCEEVRSLIMWQEWSRREYEISVGDAFEEDVSKLEKWDCYDQCVPNIKIIADAVIKQYKERKND